MFCCTFLYVHLSIEFILMGKRELVALHNLSSWCLVMVDLLFLVVPWGCLRFVIVVFPDHTHVLFLTELNRKKKKSAKGKLHTLMHARTQIHSVMIFSILVTTFLVRCIYLRFLDFMSRFELWGRVRRKWQTAT